MPGKVSPDDLLAHVFERTGAAETDETIVQGPADGARTPPRSTGPTARDARRQLRSDLSGCRRGGHLGIYVATNDVAVSGADPRWLTVVVLLPLGADESALEEISHDLDDAARAVGASIVGGHSEYVDQLERPLLS